MSGFKLNSLTPETTKRFVNNKINQAAEKNTFASSPRIVVLGVGNELLSDEGVGIHVVKELQKMEVPPHVEVIEGGTDGFGLLNIITDTDRLIVIDSVKGGSPPGTLYKFDIEDAPNASDLFKTSVHQISILEVIHLSELIGKTPQTTVLGVEPGSIETEMSLTPDVQQKIPRIIELIFEMIEESAPETPNA
ncbi:MAG: hydrogenase maturation protease [Calditrichaeota bacterium]|nr:hydrogenase maturation protease [Calditrichota bacterium]